MYKTLTKNGQLFAFGLGLLLTLAFLGSVLTNLKGSMKGLIGFVVLLAIFGVAYSTATLESGPFWDPILARNS